MSEMTPREIVQELDKHIIGQDEAKRAGKDSNNMAPGFQISGLGQLIDAGIQADRLVVFGD